MSARTSPRVTLRRLRGRDWPHVAPLVREFYAHFGYRFRDSVQGRVFRQLADDPGLGCAWVVEHRGETIGYLVLVLAWSIEYGGRIAVVDEIFITEAQRGKGLGAAVLRQAKRAARRLCIRRLFLEVESYNVGAKRFYRDLGFLDTRRTLMTVPLGATH